VTRLISAVSTERTLHISPSFRALPYNPYREKKKTPHLSLSYRPPILRPVGKGKTPFPQKPGHTKPLMTPTCLVFECDVTDALAGVPLFPEEPLCFAPPTQRSGRIKGVASIRT
jgi:hypothetical protein